MKRLFKWSKKDIEVEITLKSGRKVNGYVFRYYRDPYTMRDGDYEYWVGYDGGMMEQVKPSEIQSIVEFTRL